MAVKNFSFVIVCALLLSSFFAYAKKNCTLPCDRTKKCKKIEKNKNFFDLDNIASKENVAPIVVLGAGPAGLSAGLYGAGQYDTVVISGERPSLLTETSYVENWLGAPHQLGADLIQASYEQAEKAGARFIESNVEEVNFDSWPYAITLDDGKIVHALTLIIATGSRPLMLGIPGEKEYWARGVSACARCDAGFYKNKKVVVVGGGNAAIEEAVELSRFAKEVTIIHRRSQLRAASAMQARLKSYPQITIMYDTTIQEVVGDNKKVTAIKVAHNKTGQQATLPIDGIFLAIGHKPNVDLFEDKLELDDDECVVVKNNRQMTSKEGVFAAGDVANHYRQAIIAAGEGAKAAIDAIEFLESLGFTMDKAKRVRAMSIVEPQKEKQQNQEKVIE